MNWTKEQELAISQRDKNIIVSAAAGSGKTAVLVERIRRLAIEEGVPLDRMLVVTFTNAAAAEMKEKIRKALLKELESSPDKSVQIRAQLDRLPMASISTFHAFAGSVIRRFFYLADVDAKYKICDDERGKLLKEEALDVVIENAISSEDDDVLKFFDCYSSDKDFNTLRGVIENLYKNIIASPDKFEILDKSAQELSMDLEAFKRSGIGKIIESTVKKNLAKARKNIYSAVEILQNSGLVNHAKKIAEADLAIVDQLISFSDIIENFDAIGEILCSFSAIKLGTKKDEKEKYDMVKEEVASLRKDAKDMIDDLVVAYFTDSLEDSLFYMNETATHARVLSNLVKQYDSEFIARKRKYNLLDFNDMEHICLEILKNEEACSYYKEKFKCILVDEFQDTNLIQDEIINSIKSDNNLFMVGDIKQCIYKFRLAEPEIFHGIYDSYSRDDNSTSCSIDLNKNYRSKEPVIRFINRLFYKIMPGYDEKAALYCGLDYDGPYNYEAKFDLIDTKQVVASLPNIDADSDDEENLDNGDGLILNLSELEIEAQYVSDLIEEHVGKPFWDSKKQVERLLEPKDIVVLLRSTKGAAEAYYDAIKSKGIDAIIEQVGGFFENLEIDVFINLLNVIDNRKQDIPLISVLHSDIFGFSSAELAQIRANHIEGKFFDAFLSYAEGESELSLKCKAVLESFAEWKHLSKVMPLDDFIWKVMLDTGHYIMAGAMPLGNQRQMNLRLLVEKSKEFAASNQSGLFGFLTYLKNLKVKNYDAAQSSGFDENENAVKIMTIHKSKGLEFPMVIVGRMSKKLNYTSSKGNVIFQRDTGLGITYINNEQRWKKKTLMENAVKDAYRTEEESEEKRVLYVAMTRARDILYLVGTTSNAGKLRNNVDFEITGTATYTDMILPYIPYRIVAYDYKSHIKSSDESTGGLTKMQLLSSDIYSEEPTQEARESIRRRLDYEYPHKASKMIHSKYSVSELNKINADMHGDYDCVPETKDVAGVNLRVPSFASGAHEYTAAEAGTVYHAIMEQLDFVHVAEKGADFIKTSVEDLISRGIILKEEAELIDLDNVSAFFDTELGKRAVAADICGKLNKEHNFTLNVTEHKESFIVQGIIDGYFEEDGALILFDYKTNRIRRNQPVESEYERIRSTYEMQMKLYKSALEKATGKTVKEAYLFLADVGREIKCF